jgi:hypothetical protein
MADWNAIAVRIGMLGSDYDGEVLAAASALKRCLRKENVTFASLASRISGMHHSMGQQKYSTVDVVEVARQMLQDGDLSDKEACFVFEMMGRAEEGHQMSARQVDWFNALLRRCGNL